MCAQRSVTSIKHIIDQFNGTINENLAHNVILDIYNVAQQKWSALSKVRVFCYYQTVCSHACTLLDKKWSLQFDCNSIKILCVIYGLADIFLHITLYMVKHLTRRFLC